MVINHISRKNCRSRHSPSLFRKAERHGHVPELELGNQLTVSRRRAVSCNMEKSQQKTNPLKPSDPGAGTGRINYLRADKNQQFALLARCRFGLEEPTQEGDLVEPRRSGV